MKHRLLAIIFISGLLFSIVASFLAPKAASADETSDIRRGSYSFQDSANIVGDFGGTGKIDFVDKNPTDSTPNYAPTSGNFCNPLQGVPNAPRIGITLDQAISSSNVNNKHFSGNLWLGYTTTTTIGVNTQTKCHNVSGKITIDNPNSAAQYNAQWDGNNITTLSGEINGETFAPATNFDGLYIDTNTPNGGCGNAILLAANPGGPDKGIAYLISGSGVGSDLPSNIAPAFDGSCKMIASIPVVIKGTPGTPAANPGGAAGGAGAANKQLGCDIQFTNPLTWIICPIVDTLVQIINFIDNLITDQMNVKTDAIFCTSGSNLDNCTAYYHAWKSFRDIALGLMALAGLVIVIAQALGVEILDAYTIRKALPRLLIAAIAITLSWPLMQFLIQLSDDLGFGIRHLIYAPFSGLSEHLDLSFGSGVADVFFGAGTVAAGALVAVPAWMLLGGPAALLAYAGTAALAVLVAIVVLILRQVAIILMMLLAPIAIVAYILPNTQRAYRLWWESFSKALLMFPLIAAFIATGRVFSAIAIQNGGAANQLIGFAAYFAPYFMIPLTFRMAGSAMSGLGNFVQSRAQPGFSMLSNWRGQQRKSRLERARGQGFYRKQTGLPGLLNKIGLYTLDVDEQLPYDLGTGHRAGRLTGRAGKRMFGRMAGEMAGKKAGMLTDHIAEGVKQANMHYSTSWGVLGMRDQLADGMTARGLAAMDAKYGLDEHGNRSSASGLAAVRWQPPEGTDYHGWLQYGEMLRDSEDGSMAQTAGRELDAGRVGILTSFGKHMETQRANPERVALASMAKDGKLPYKPNDIDVALNTVNAMRRSPDPATRAFADAQMSQMEAAASQQHRQDWRRGKGHRVDSEGMLYNVHSKKEVKVRQDDGSYAMVPAYQTREAYDDSNSMKAQAAMGAKAESIRAQADTIVDMANEGRPILKEGEAEAMRVAVAAGTQNYYTDPDSQVAWQEIAKRLETPLTPEEIAEGKRQSEDAERRRQGTVAPQPPPDAPAPPIIPPSSAMP